MYFQNFCNINSADISYLTTKKHCKLFHLTSRHYIMANVEGVRHFSTQPLFCKAVQGGGVRMGDFSVAPQYVNHDTILSVHEVWRWISKYQTLLLL